VFTGHAINDLIDLFGRREVSVYHSCQFVDLQSYIHLRCIPSRKLLEDSRLPFTVFETDGNDVVNGVWDKVFLNPLDLGEIFAFGKPIDHEKRDADKPLPQGVPTCYGPIAFVVRREALSHAEDVAICLRSAGAEGFCREKEALTSIQDVERLFWCYGENLSFPFSAKTKGREGLKREFRTDSASHPEISCSYREMGLPLEFTAFLLVDPYEIGGKSLKRVVEDWLTTQSVNIEVKERGCFEKRRAMYNELAEILIWGIPRLQELNQMTSASEDLRSWAWEVEHQGLEYMWRRFTDYFRKGTLQPLLDHVTWLPF